VGQVLSTVDVQFPPPEPRVFNGCRRRGDALHAGACLLVPRWVPLRVSAPSVRGPRRAGAGIGRRGGRACGTQAHVPEHLLGGGAPGDDRQKPAPAAAGALTDVGLQGVVLEEGPVHARALVLRALRGARPERVVLAGTGGARASIRYPAEENRSVTRGDRRPPASYDLVAFRTSREVAWNGGSHRLNAARLRSG
jgi:hypothetical protein